MDLVERSEEEWGITMILESAKTGADVVGW
jgi:hypothetical protein